VVCLGLGLVDGLVWLADGQKTLKFSRFALLGWLAVLVGVRRKKKAKQGWRFWPIKADLGTFAPL